MPKAIQLTVAEPCHENWDKMTPDQQGRFCGSCQKQVVDFTHMSDRELAQFFKKPSTGSVCGRFMDDQLERDILIPKRRLPWIKYLLQIFLPVFFVSKAGAQKTMGKPAARPVKDTSKVTIVPDNRVLGKVARGMDIRPVCTDQLIPLMGDTIINKSVQVKGRVFGEQGESLANASIRVVRNGLLIVADSAGRFILNTGNDRQLLEVEFSAAGYATKKLMIDPEKYKKEEYIVLLTANAALPEVIVTALPYMGMVSRRNVTGGTTVIRKEQLEVKPIPQIPVVNNNLQVYPNPVQAGQSINISFEKMEEGYYTVQFMGINGQTLQHEQIWIDSDARVMNLKLPALPAGICLLVLTNKLTGKQTTEKIIVQ